MAGGRIAYRQPHKIVLGSGDYSWDGIYAPEAYAQKPDNDYGKVLEIDLNSGKSRKLSIGHRNMQGVLVHLNGQVWVTEHGPRGGDELNRVIGGGNFGWPEEVLGTRLELPRFRGQFIALAIMKCFSNHSASNRIPKARTLCSAQ